MKKGKSNLLETDRMVRTLSDKKQGPFPVGSGPFEMRLFKKDGTVLE